nr:ERF family protein [uncultured Clostridium sp.]
MEKEKQLNLYQKLQKVRVELQNSKLKKSGKNTFSKYEYFELGDFLPKVNELCEKYNLSTIFQFTKEQADLIIIDVDDTEKFEVFSTPVEITSLKGGTAMQNIGATQTYARRYLYVMAFEIAESDLIDAVDYEAEIAKAKISPVKVKIIQKAIEDTNTVLEKFLSYFGVTKINDIVEGQFQQAMSMLDKKKEEMAKEKKNDVGGIVW